MPTFSGDTRACLAHVLSHDEKIRVPMAKFAKVVNPTTRRWKRGLMPKGEPLIRVRFFLKGMGYEVSELNALEPLVLDLGRLLAYDIDTLKSLGILGYERPQAVIDVMTGRRNLSGEKRQKLEALVASKREKLNDAVSKFEKKTNLTSPAPQKKEVPQNDLARMLVDQTVSLLNSQASILRCVDPATAEIYDNERMEIKQALKGICNTFGIQVRFPSSQASLTPVTREDLAATTGKASS